MAVVVGVAGVYSRPAREGFWRAARGETACARDERRLAAHRHWSTVSRSLVPAPTEQCREGWWKAHWRSCQLMRVAPPSERSGPGESAVAAAGRKTRLGSHFLRRQRKDSKPSKHSVGIPHSPPERKGTMMVVCSSHEFEKGTQGRHLVPTAVLRQSTHWSLARCQTARRWKGDSGRKPTAGERPLVGRAGHPPGNGKSPLLHLCWRRPVPKGEQSSS